MLKNKTFLAIIPARGGSKRLPRKNILELAGKPLIAWSIEASLQSKYIDNTIVTSDDDEILSISKKFGSNILKRPEKLANDLTNTFDAIKHVIDNTALYDYIILLQPTSPLRTTKHIDDAIELLIEKNAKAIVSVCEMDHSPLWSNTLSNNHSMENFLDNKIINSRSQDLKPYFRINGAIYLVETSALVQEKKFLLDKNIFAYIMDQRSSIDIDTKLDFTVAKCLYETSNI